MDNQITLIGLGILATLLGTVLFSRVVLFLPLL